MFTCQTTGGFLVWVINGTQRETLHSDTRKDYLITSQTVTDEGSTIEELTIQARAKYNGTRIQCASLLEGNSAESESAFIKIQGKYILIILAK